MRTTTKFMRSKNLVEQSFQGPFCLDELIVKSLISNHPGIYVWVDYNANEKFGYVGQSTCLVDRLVYWAKKSQGKEFYYRYVPIEKLNSEEKRWICYAGDLNSV